MRAPRCLSLSEEDPRSQDPVRSERRRCAALIRSSVDRNVDLDEATWCRCRYSLGDLGQPLSDQPPPPSAKHHDRDAAASQTLLMTDVTVSGDEDLKAGSFRRIKQLAVSEGVPASCARFFDGMRARGIVSKRLFTVAMNFPPVSMYGLRSVLAPVASSSMAATVSRPTPARHAIAAKASVQNAVRTQDAAA